MVISKTMGRQMGSISQDACPRPWYLLRHTYNTDVSGIDTNLPKCFPKTSRGAHPDTGSPFFNILLIRCRSFRVY